MKTTQMMKWCAGLMLGLVIFASAPAPAAEIVTFDFAGLAGSELAATNNAKDANLSNSVITRGAGLTASGNGDRFNATSWATSSIANAISGNDYMEFTITPNSGYQFGVTSLVVKLQRSSTGNTVVSLRSSVDSYASALGTDWTVTDGTTTQTNTWTFTQSDSEDPVTYRLYSYAESTGGSGGPGDGSGNDIVVYGAVTASAVAPTLTSPTATSIGQTNATLGANITSDGGDSLDERGTVYDTAANPVINGLAEGGTATGVFSHARTGFSQGTKYYYRGYAVNGIGTGYSPDGSFYTEPGQASDIIFSLVGADTMRISWSAGPDCDGSIVVIREGNSAVADPTDGVLHDADANFGDGDDLGDGSYVVYRDSSTQVDVTGLSPNTTYYVEIFAYRGTVADSGVDQGINYRQTDPEAGNQETEDTAPELWTNLEQRGVPVYTYYLGDYLAYQFDFAINTDTSGFTVNAGIGQSQNGSSWHWYNASYSGQDGNNRWWKSATGEHQFTSTGAWYYSGRFITNAYTYYAPNAWEANTAGPLTATNYFQVDALTAPSGVSAAKDGTHPASRADLGWTQWNSKNVLITRATATPTGSPTQGQAYSANDTFGNQTVISGSQSGSSLEVTGLIPGQTYYFTFYSENHSYYSAGATADSVGTDMPQARNTDGGSPEAPATIYLGDSGKTFGLDSWGTLDSNWGAARLWLRFDNADVSGGTASAWSDFTDANHKTRTSGVFNEIGTWYWGMQMDYGSPYGTDFWYKASSADWADLAANGAGATLTVTVSAIVDPADQTATVNATHPSSQIDLGWSKNAQGNNVMVMRKLSTDSWTEPTQGTAYSAGNTLGAGTVVYNGADTGVTATGLSESSTYDFKFYSVNNDYYSAGVTAQENTEACAPAAPTGVHANPTNYTDMTVNWTASSGATGYRLDVSTEEEFGSAVLATDLFFSEYVEGSSNEKYIEIYNGTGASVDLSNYALILFSNGSATPTTNKTLAGTLANGSVAIYRHSSATNLIGTTSTAVNYNGDDAVALSNMTTHAYVDIFGRIGEDPGNGWTNAATGNYTVDRTLVRKSSVLGGVTSNPESGFPTLGTEWDMYANNTEQYLGSHTFDGGTTPSYVAGYSNLYVAGTSQSVTGLAQATTYYFRVRAEGDGGCPSVNSDTGSATTLEQLVVEINSTAINVREAGEGRFFVRLNRDPLASVVVNISRSAGDASLTIQQGAQRSFNSGNWSVWQVVTLVQAADDGNTDNETATIQVSLAGADDQFITAKALDDDIGENLALASGGSTITASEEPYRPEQLIDGVHTSAVNYGWTIVTTAPPGTITLDLKNTTTVSRVRLLNWDWSYRIHRYTIEYSVNGSSWNTLVDASGSDRQGWDDWTIADQTARYLRLTGLTTSDNLSAFSVAELEVYGSRDLSNLPKPVLLKTDVNVKENGEGRFFVRLDKEPEGSVLVYVTHDSGDANITIQNGTTRSFSAANWNAWQSVTLVAADDANTDSEEAVIKVASPGVASQYVTASSLDDDLGTDLALASGGATITGTKVSRPAQVIDGIHTVSTNYGYTIWTNVPPGTMTVDLKERYELSRVRVLNWDWVARVHRYQIEYSENGTSWTTLVNASGEDHSGWDEWILSDEMARYLRFTGLSNSVNQCVVLSELEVYGVAAPPPLSDATLSDSAVNVRENGQGRFFIRLPSAPTGNVVFTVSRISGSADITVQNGATRAFTAANWSSWQSVTLAAAADGNTDGETATFQISAAGYEDTFVTATALDDDIAENVALASGGATIAYWKGGQVAKLIDGIQTDSANYGWTYWTNVPQGTITLDMKAQMTVSRIRLLGWDWVYRLQGYQIEASTDGVGWSTIITAASGRHGWDEWTLADETIRYLRFTGLTNTANNTVCISELEVYGTRPAGRRALAKGAVVASTPVSVLTSEGVEDESGWNAVDGDAGTAWVGSQAGGGYVVVEYAPALTLKALEVDLAEGSLTGVEYLYSQDGEDWQPLPEDLEANPVSLNFLWLAFPGDGTAAVPSVIEIRPNP